MIRHFLWMVCCVGSLSAVVWAQPATFSQDSKEHSPLSSEQEQRVARISEAVLSPFCPGQTLATCPSPNAKAWREDIKQWVKEGVASPEIAARLQARVPENNLSGMPPQAWYWFLPLVGITLASLILFGILRRIRIGTDASEEAHTPNASEMARADTSSESLDGKLDDELAKF